MAKSKIERGVTSRGIVVSSSHLADLLSIQLDTINKLHKEGLFGNCLATEDERADAGIANVHKKCFWSKDAIEVYYRYKPLTKDHARESNSRARKEEAEAVIAEVKAAKAIGEVASTEDIIQITTESLTIFKEGILSLSSSVISELVAAENDKEMQQIIDREVKNVLTQLASDFSSLRDNLPGYDYE